MRCQMLVTLVGLGLTAAAAAQESPRTTLRDRVAEPSSELRATPPTRITYRLPPPFPQVEWSLPLDAYPSEAPAASPETPTPEASPTPAPSPTPSPAPTEPEPEPELGAPISGILTFPGGDRPAANRMAVLIDKDTGRIVATTMTNGEGAFTFPPQPKASYRVELGRKIRRPD